MKNLNLVHLNGLRALEAVGRLGSLQAAADELAVSAGAISQQIIKAEAQLQHQIFERTPKGLVPTRFGAPLLARLSAGFTVLSEAVAIAQRRDETVLTISVAPVFAARWLVHRIDRFTQLYPHISLRIEASNRLAAIGAGDIDLGIRVGAGRWPGVVAELLLEQEVFPVCAPALAARLRVPADILTLPAVIDDRAMFPWSLWLEAAGLKGASMVTRHSFNDASLCLDAAIGGQGVMLAWQTLAVYALGQGCLVVPFDIRVKTGFGHYFVTASGRREPEKVRAFKAWVRAEIADSIGGAAQPAESQPVELPPMPVPSPARPSSP